MSRQSERKPQNHTPGEPIDVLDGIPDRSPATAWWRYAVLLAIFLAWVALLVYIQTTGRLTP